MKIGDRVKVVRQNFGNSYIGREGKITSIGRGVIPIYVTLDGEKTETDFAEDELKAL